ncbi:retrotransposon protein, putative, ty1-copia subclass [Tanacetum coccineum]
MRALLIQHECEAALEVLPVDMEAQTKAELNKKDHSAVILCLCNKVLREVTGETTAAGDVMATLDSKEIKEMYKAKGGDGKGLYVRGRTDRRDARQSRGKSRSKSRGGRLKCYICQRETVRRIIARSQHVTSRKMSNRALVVQLMTTLSVQLGDNRECKIRGIGKVRLQLKDGSSFVLHNVRYIPELKRNLISLGTLEKEGYTVKMQSGKIKVINGSRVILSGIRRDNCVYSLDGHAMTGELNASVEEKDSLAQSHRVSFGVGRHTTQGVIDYVHSDLWGPSQVESLGGKRYFLSIVDDYSRRVWVYILRFKHEAFGKFKEWKQLVENQTGRTVKKLRTDNGLEFCNREFEQLCIESGIARHLTVAGTPQQNGVAERMNRTLMDKVRCLLIQSGLPKTFWAEATCTAAYLINRSPSTAIEKKTPMEMWSGHPSDYGMLRIFGCVAYPHDKQGKLEPRAIKCVLLGYPEGVKGYRLYRLDGESPKIVTSRNVVFNESVMYKDTLKDSGAGDKSVEELQVEVELQRLNNHTPEEDQTDQEDGDDEDAGDQETDQPPDLTNYHNMAAYAFVAAEEEDTHEPLTYQEGVACEDSSKWKAAMEEEMDSLRKNKTWELVDHPAGAGIDYNEVFSPIVRYISIWIIIALTACKDYELDQLDVKMAFLHGNLEEVIYMRQPQGYEQGKKVCLLKKSLYGLKQSPRQWYRRFDEYMLSNEFKRSNDMLIACKSKAEIESTKSLLKKEFDILTYYVSKILNILEIDNGKGNRFKMPIGWAPQAVVEGICPGRGPGQANAVCAQFRRYLNDHRGQIMAIHGKYQRVLFIQNYARIRIKREAEYKALTGGVKEVFGLRGLLE